MNKQFAKHNFLSALAFLHSEIQGRRITTKFLEEDGQITVLLDSSLVISGLRPHLNGPAPRDLKDFKRGGLGQLLPRLPDEQIHKIRSKSGEMPTVNAFRTSEDIQAWHVTSALIAKVYEIARGQQGGQKVFQFASHHKETSDVFRIIEEKYNKLKRLPGSQQNSAFLEAAQRNFRRETAALAIHHFMTENADIDGVADIVMERGEQAMMAWSGGSSTLEREHEALNKLKTSGLPERFSIDQFLGGKIASDKFDRSFLEVETHARSVMHNFFHGRLTRKKGFGSSTGLAHEADLEALVDLSCYNKRLMQKEINHRILFATTDRNLVLSAYAITGKSIRNAVRAYGLTALRLGNLKVDQARELITNLEAYFGLTQCDEFNKNGHRWLQNFAGHYMRHLWAVSEDALIETDQSRSVNQVEGEDGQIAQFVNPDMFNGLYAKAALRIKVSRRSVEKLFTTNSFLDDEALEEFDVRRTYVHWNHLIRTQVKTWRIKNFGFDRLGEEDPALQSMAELFPKLVYVFLEEFSNRNRDRAMVNLSDNGALDLISQLAQKNLRGRPIDLNFLTLTNTNRIFQHVAHKSYYLENVTKFSEEFKSINYDCFGDERERDAVFDDRQRSHLKLLVLAAIFAAMEKWAAAKDHTRRAIDIIKRSKVNSLAFSDAIPTKNALSNMSGREAWYMESICHRMLAETDQDFERAGISLDQSVSALWSDIQHNEKIDKHFHMMRLLNEKWSQRISSYYLKRSLLDRADAPITVPPIDELQSALGFRWSLEMGAQEYDLSLTDLFAYLRVKSGSERKSDLTRLTTDAIALNFIQIAMVRSFWLDQAEEDLSLSTAVDLDEAAQLALNWLSARKRDSDYIESFLVRLYRIGLPTVDPRFYGEKFKNETSLKKAFDFVEAPKQINENRVAYDIWRIKSLRDFIGGAVKEK